MKIGLIGSSGGHLTHLLLLQEWWKEHERFWVTFNKEDSRTALADENTYWCHHPTNRNIRNLFRNMALAWTIIRKERPDILISTGAAVAVPFFYLGKLFGVKLVYIEVYDRITSPTLTGRMVYPITNAFIVQWEEQKKFYPKGLFMGGLF